ncbi:MAG: glycoside hydrolase family 32 protein [Balneolaceae bacterium]|nr:glycoside hydrolase family 32 protein [Balneolaceae bacterium]
MIRENIFLQFLLILLALIFVGCEEQLPEETEYDPDRIDQHLAAQVNFSEPYRPQFHYSPKINWMNDPNGLVYYDGVYHLFHQYNPFGNRWGYMSWGHATSTDLVHWDHKAVAIPYGKEEEEGIFSGSAVVDHQNTSGFGDGGDPPIVAIYTSHYTREDGSTDQAQSLAYSIDGGQTFTKFEGNPVLEFDDPDFRDPNVSWNEEMGRWLMVVALPTQHKVQFYASDNLKDWEYLSDFGPAGATGGIWECPDFFRLPVDGNPEIQKWVLHVDMNPGSVAGGSGSQYFVGEWDGTSFIPDETFMETAPHWTDYGTDFYAAISWNNIPEEDGRQLWVGWMNNWDYANEIPTHPWRSAMSIPRSIHLESNNESYSLVQKPVESLRQLREDPVRLENLDLSDETIDLSQEGISGKAFEMIVEIEPGDAESVGINVREAKNQRTVIGYNSENQSVFVDRTNSGESDFFEGFEKRNDAPVNLSDGTVKLRIFVDWSSVEVFVNDGSRVITNRIFPDPESIGVSAFADGGSATITNIEFWPLESIWTETALE